MSKFTLFNQVRLFSFLSIVLISAAPSHAETVKLGAILPVTRELAMHGNAFREGIELGLEEVNAANPKYQFEVLIEDTEGKPKLAANAAKKLISVDKIVAVIASSYQESAIARADFERSRVPVITLWDSSPQLEALGDYIFAIGPWTPSAAEESAAFVVERLSAKSAVIVGNVEEWSTLVSDLFERAFEVRGGRILARYSINTGDSDFRSVITKTKSLKPDIVYAPLVSHIVEFHKQAHVAKLGAQIVSSDIITDEHIAQAPEAFEGLYQTGVKDPESALFQKLVDAYQKKHGRSMTMPWFVATGYDAVRLFAHAITQVGTDGEKIKDFLYSVKDFPGAQQAISFNPGGSSPYLESMFRVQSGKFIVAE